MTIAMPRLLFALFVLLLPAAARAGGRAPTTRQLVYPALSEEGEAPPELHLSVDGTSLTLYFPEASLDSRPEVHLLSSPDAVELRVAEHAAYLLLLPGAVWRRPTPIVLTLTLADGRPLTFSLVPTDPSRADTLVEVRLEGQEDRACPVRLAEAEDALAACREQRGRSGVQLVAALLARTHTFEEVASVQRLRWRDKQHHIFVQVLDLLHLGDRAFLRLLVENRDPQGARWRPGTVRMLTDDPIEPRRLPVQVVTDAEDVGPGQTLQMVIAFEPIDLPRGIHLRAVLSEAGGTRHLVVRGF